MSPGRLLLVWGLGAVVAWVARWIAVVAVFVLAFASAGVPWAYPLVYGLWGVGLLLPGPLGALVAVAMYTTRHELVVSATRWTWVAVGAPVAFIAGIIGLLDGGWLDIEPVVHAGLVLGQVALASLVAVWFGSRRGRRLTQRDGYRANT